MKIFVVSSMFILHAVVCIAQEINYKDLSSGPKGEYTSYVSKDGATYKIGDRLKLGVPSSNKTFAFVYEGDGLLLPMTNVGSVVSGTETEIKRIFVVGNKRAGYSVTLRTKGFTGLANYSVLIENAIAAGEVVSFGKTSDEALAELKKAKDKLDLGLITKEEYEKLKAELSAYIK